jgi:phosphate transport system protein
MKVSNNLERISDQSVNIAKRARRMNKYPELPETKLLEPIYRMAAAELDAAVAAYRDGDVKVSLTLDERDDSLDTAQKKLIKDLTRRGEADAPRVGGYINLIFIARSLERIGDRAVNIAEDCVYAEAAVDIRHGGTLPENI